MSKYFCWQKRKQPCFYEIWGSTASTSKERSASSNSGLPYKACSKSSPSLCPHSSNQNSRIWTIPLWIIPVFGVKICNFRVDISFTRIENSFFRAWRLPIVDPFASNQSNLWTETSIVMLVLCMGPEGCEFFEGTRNDFTHAVTSAGTLLLMLGKLLNHIQSHYHHPTAEFDTIEVPLPLKVVSDSSKNPNPPFITNVKNPYSYRPCEKPTTWFRLSWWIDQSHLPVGTPPSETRGTHLTVTRGMHLTVTHCHPSHPHSGLPIKHT